MEMPRDLRIAYETFTLLCLKYNISYAGLAMSLDPPAFFTLGNVTEKGHDFAKLLREFAKIVDEKTDQGLVVSQTPSGSAEAN